MVAALVSPPPARARPGWWPPLFSVATGALTVAILVAVRDAATPASSWSRRPRWIRDLGISWHLGVDGISLFLVVLTGVLFPIAILGAPAHHDEKPYFAWLLLLEAGCIGVFLALDLFLFFVFFEIVLVPMYFLIGGWGYAERRYAAMKFFLYTMFGSAFMLVGLVATAVPARAGRRRRPHLRPGRRSPRTRAIATDDGPLAVPRPSPSPSPSRCRCSRCTPGCPTPTPRRPPPAR